MSILLRYLPQEKNARGICFALIALFLFSLMAAMAKYFSDRYSIFEIGFFRFLFALIPLLPLIVKEGGWEVFRTTRIKGHLWRSAVGLASLVFYFYSIKYLPLSDAVAISFTNPLFIALLSILMLKESVGIHRWAAIILGFIGVVLIARPHGLEVSAGVVFGLGSALFYALAMVSLRTLGSTEKVLTTTSYFTSLATIMLAIPTAFSWTPPSFIDFILFILCGVCAGIGQLLLTKAYQLAPPSIISPFNYSAIVWATLIGILFWGHIPDMQVLLGTAIVVASGLYIIHRERVKKKDPLPPEPGLR